MAENAKKILCQFSPTSAGDWWPVRSGASLSMFFGDDCREDPFVITGSNEKTGEVWIARRGTVVRIVSDRPEELAGCDLRWMTEGQIKADWKDSFVGRSKARRAKAKPNV